MSRSLLFSILLIASTSASATTLIDGSFETPNLGVGNYSYSTQPLGWTGTGALVNAQGASAWYGSAPPSGQDGAQFYALQEKTSVYQNFTATKSGKLTVSWLSAGRPNAGSYGGNQSYDVSLTGSGIELGSLGTFTTHDGQAFERLSGTGFVTAGQIYSLEFRGLSSSDQTAFIDGVSVVGGVPEAATWTMMIAGFGLVGAASRMRRSAVA
ncbi:PEPxxWA-CTERM sorting domain-containing protein [Polymorphobacter sp. PAMC 29334]|uniref:PEPxxWA-CTERM sorting domain-containing protein n=1 Tax=Polymorphobacter sp. PAMC 29334 TaxID=2862331 RepID=UPI001C75DFF6|nr:PEPxxWA-CTERM sorting domain-containing protein [Polymorphobacter sp. PAMC 29334]QYE36311.1 PEPxxWA-CTERM sorting domain-containing protein [Polymorphobacter sp. PAMC 29334]